MKRQSRPILKILPNLLCILVFIAFGGYILSASFSYQFKTAAFAGFSAAALIILSIALLVREIRRSLADTTPESDDAPKTTSRGLVIPLLWAVGLLAGIFLIGLLWTVPIWVFIFLIMHKGRILAVAGSLIMWALLKFGIQIGLEGYLFPGILFGGVLPRLF